MEKSDNLFDKEIKSLLDSHQPDVTPQWDHMQSQLDAAYDDEIFDEKIRKTLNNAQAYHEKMAWESLEQKIKMQAERKRKLITARLIESTLFILFLWTLDNIGITNLIQDKIQIQPQIMALELSDERNSNLDFSQIVPTNTDLGFIPLVQKDKKENTEVNFPSGLTNQKENMQSVVFRNSVSNLKHESKINSLASHHQVKLQTDLNLSEKDDSKNLQYQAKNNLHFSELNPDLPHNLSPLLCTLRIPEEIELPLIAEGVEYLSKPDLYALEISKQIKPLPVLYAKSIGIFAGTMVNIIQSPSFIEQDVNYIQAKLAHQMGLKFDFHQGAWTLKTGIAYQHIKYQPNYSETMGSFEGGYFKIHFKELEAHLVSLPVALSRTIASGEKWDLSMHMGLSLTASLKNKYSLDTVTDLSSNNVQNINFNPTSSSEIISRVRNASNKGLLEGGNIGTNSYASLIGGVRYQRKITSSLSYFGELELSKMLGQIGFGPNNDKFVIVGLNTGLSVRFGGR